MSFVDFWRFIITVKWIHECRCCRRDFQHLGTATGICNLQWLKIKCCADLEETVHLRLTFAIPPPEMSTLNFLKVGVISSLPAVFLLKNG